MQKEFFSFGQLVVKPFSAASAAADVATTFLLECRIEASKSAPVYYADSEISFTRAEISNSSELRKEQIENRIFPFGSIFVNSDFVLINANGESASFRHNLTDLANFYIHLFLARADADLSISVSLINNATGKVGFAQIFKVPLTRLQSMKSCQILCSFNARPSSSLAFLPFSYTPPEGAREPFKLIFD
jgi:hypothetical protein